VRALALPLTAVPPLLAALVRALAASMRLRVNGTAGLTPCWRAGRPLIYVVWHGQILMLPWATEWLRRTQGARNVAVVASRSRDGELVSRYVRRFGLAVVRGSSSRNGSGALRQLTGVLRAGGDVAIAPDGPRGPRGRIQPGVVALAALSGAPLVPLAFGACPARRLRTWDEFLVPLPFARGVVVFGEPLAVEREADRERVAKDLERALNEATASAGRLVHP
jgi:lysophospholipid acyltransferase (LPLAT)-like uncharacterized protein